MFYLFLVLMLSVFLFLRTKKRKWLSKKDWKHRLNVDRSYSHIARMYDMAGAEKMWYMRNKVSDQEFEEIVLTALRLKGLRIKRNKKYSGDGGKDGVVFIDGEKTYIQAKRYTGNVQKKHVIDFIDLVTNDDVRGLFVTCGKTSEPIRILLKENQRAMLISGCKLESLLNPDGDIRYLTIKGNGSDKLFKRI